MERAHRQNYLFAASVQSQRVCRGHAVPCYPPCYRMGIILGVVASGLALSPLGIPVLPVSWLQAVPVHEVNPELGEMIGWPSLVERVAGIYRSLPEEERRKATILTLNYGEAGAIERFGPRYDLPKPGSGHNNYWLWGPPEVTPDVVVAVGQSKAYLERLFDDVRLAASYRTRYGIENEGHGAPIWICRGPRGTWEELWPQIKGFNA